MEDLREGCEERNWERGLSFLMRLLACGVLTTGGEVPKCVRAGNLLKYANASQIILISSIVQFDHCGIPLLKRTWLGPTFFFLRQLIGWWFWNVGLLRWLTHPPGVAVYCCRAYFIMAFLQNFLGDKASVSMTFTELTVYVTSGG